MKKLIRIITLAACLVIALGCIPVSAMTPYKTYTYSIDGYALISPDAYVPDRVVSCADMGVSPEINNPNDLFVAPDKCVYIADTGNNRIVVLDRYFKIKFYLDKFVNEHGVDDALNGAQGVFVTDDKIYVADTQNNRIVMFELDGTFYRVIDEPSSDVFPEGSIYQPVALAVDNYGRIYVVSSTTNMGIILMNEDGEFQGFVGAQKVTIGVFDRFWRSFQTKEQRSLSESFVSTEFNNIAIDGDGFIYVTTSSIDEEEQQSAIEGEDGTYAPIKKFNTYGADIMKRKGFFAPSGEVNVSNLTTAEITGASKIIDVAIGPENTWSIIDEKRSKVFTYDQEGNLLFIFGDGGKQLGNIENIESIAYQDDNILVLDKGSDKFTVFRRTEYGDTLLSAIKNTNDREYDKTIDFWEDVLTRNNNFDTAYIGIGKSLSSQHNYAEALPYFKAAYDTEYYSEAYMNLRKEWMAKYILLIPLIVIVVVVLLLLWGKYARKLNKKTQLKRGRKTFWEELVYAHHLIFHPFDGFWDLKHEQRGSVRAGIVYLVITIIAFYYQDIGQGHVFNPRDEHSTILIQIASVAIPVFLWVLANWCLTTLFDGEGSFKDIFIATCYALVPLPIFIIPATIFSNFATEDEMGLINLIISFGFICTGLLLFFGMMTTHDYTFGKNVIISICTIVGMAFIIFLIILFITLIAKIVSFVQSIVTELSYRM